MTGGATVDNPWTAALECSSHAITFRAVGIWRLNISLLRADYICAPLNDQGTKWDQGRDVVQSQWRSSLLGTAFNPSVEH